MSETTYNDMHGASVRILAFALIIFIFLYATSQLVTPYIRHDDWNFLIPSNWGMSYSTPWENTLTEGRWLSYLWYQFSVHLTPKSSYLIFVIAYFYLVCKIATHAATPATFLLAGLAIFFSPMMGDLSLWPTGMAWSVTLCGLAAWLVVRLDLRFSTSIVFLATLSLVLAYPALASVILLMAAIKKIDAPVREKLSLGAAYVFGFAAGTLVIYSLNLMFHGYFGVKIAPWRNPRTPHGLIDLLSNTSLYAQYWAELVRSLWPAMICGVLASALLFRQKNMRNAATAILLATILICSVELGITMVAGTSMPTRSAVWLWVVACLLCALAAGNGSSLSRRIGSALLLALALFGASHWWGLYRENQPAATYESRLASWIHQYEATSGISDVVIVGDPRRVAELRAIDTTNPIPAFRMSMLKRYGIKTSTCTMEFCETVRKYLQARDVQQSPILVINGKLALVFDRDAVGENFERNYPSTSQEASLKLSYPLYLAYGNEAVRLTPFFPGTSPRPVSINLESTRKGYTLQFEGSSCAFPIEYRLMTADQKQLATGELAPSTTSILPNWAAQRGIVTLSVSMAPRATNNYACNIVVSKIQ